MNDYRLFFAVLGLAIFIIALIGLLIIFVQMWLRHRRQVRWMRHMNSRSLEQIAADREYRKQIAAQQRIYEAKMALAAKEFNASHLRQASEAWIEELKKLTATWEENE